MRKKDEPTSKLTFLKSTLKPFQQNGDARFFDSCRSTSRWSLSQLLNGTALNAPITLFITQATARMDALNVGGGSYEQELKDQHLAVHNISNTAVAVFTPIFTILGAVMFSVCTRRMQRLQINPNGNDISMDNPYVSGTLKSFGIGGLTAWAFCTIMMHINCFDKNDNSSQQVTCTRNWLNAELELWAAFFILGLIITVGLTCHVKKKVERMDDERIKLLDDDANSDRPDALLGL